MPASLHPLHSLRAFPSKKHNQSPESRPRDPRDGMKIRLNDYLRCAYSRIGEAGRWLPTNRARCIERKIASRDPLSKIIPPRIPASLTVAWPATTIARENAFLCLRPFHRLIIERWPPVFLLPLSSSLLFLSPSYRYRTTRDAYSYISRTRGFVSNAATTSYYTDFWKPRQRVERRAWPAFPLRRSLRSRQFRSRIERYVLPMISKSYALSFSNYNDI